MKPELWLSVVVRDRQGKIISRFRRKSRSFVKAYNQMVYLHLAQGTTTVKDIGGVNRAGSRSKYSFRMNSPIANTNYGIIIGTGNTAVTINDYAVETLIVEGAGAGQMNYQATSVGASSVSAPTCGWITTRSVVNNSGGLITVRESALYGWLNEFDGWYNCLVRDVFGTAQDVPNGGSITVNYTVRVSA